MQENIPPKDISLETALLKSMSYKENFKAYSSAIDYKRVLPCTSLLLQDYGKYFELFTEHDHIDFGEFQTQFSHNWHINDLDQLDIEYYRDYVFPAIQKYDNNDVYTCLLGLIKKQAAEKLIQTVSTSFEIEKIRNILDEYSDKISSYMTTCDEDVWTINNVDFEVLDNTKGIPYFLPSLQMNLGSLVKGQFVVVSADYGVGKTAFVLSQAANTFRHLVENNDNRPILYFNSEGTEGDVFARFISNLFSSIYSEGFEQIINQRDEIRRKFVDKYPTDKFLVFQLSGKNLTYIRNKLKKYNPALVIIDITDVLAPEEDVTNLKKVYDNLRLLSGEYCPIIGTTQAGDTSYLDKETNKIKTRKWLGDKALYGSKSGKGGAADTIITIGKDDNNPRLRYISTPKKKRGTQVNVTCEIEDIYSLYRELTF